MSPRLQRSSNQFKGEVIVNKLQILKTSALSGWEIAKAVYSGLSQIKDWNGFKSFKVEHIISNPDNPNP
jgi:hypothetical protein